MLDIDDIEDTETSVMALRAGAWGEIQLKLGPPILSAEVTIWRAVVVNEMKRPCTLAIASFLFERDAMSIFVRS